MADYVYPVGATVRSTPFATRAHGRDRFPDGVTLTGTVMEYHNGSLHINWGEGFRGHRDEGDDIHNGHCYYMGLGEIELVTGIPIISISPSDIPRLRVTISRSADRHGNPWMYKIENGPRQPLDKNEVKGYIDKAIVRRMGSRTWRNDLQTIVDRGINTYGIDPQVFVDAITAAVLARQAREATGTFTKAYYDAEMARVMATEPMVMAIGDQLFTLQPKGSIKSGKVMAAIRERITNQAKLMAERISVAAKMEAAGIIANGERQLAAAKVKIDEERAAMKMAMTIPSWVAMRGLKLMNDPSSRMPLRIGIEIDTKITAWQMIRIYGEMDGDHKVSKIETVRWTVSSIPELRHYHTITVWMPFDPATGRYDYKNTAIKDGNSEGSMYVLPHITYRGCFDLQGMPERLTGYEEYNQIRNVIVRGCREVNMDSLLGHVNEWHPDIYNQLPPGLLKIVKAGLIGTENIPIEYFDGAERTPVEVEARETFNIESLREARRARGEELPDIEVNVPVEEMLIETDTEREEVEDNG